MLATGCLVALCVIVMHAAWSSSSTGIAAQARDRETFDAISIKEHRRGSEASRLIRQLPSGLAATKVTVLDLIALAFDVTQEDIVGALPGWSKTTTFDVVARSAGDPLTHSRLRAMSRALLEDRFRLDASFERTEGPTYALVMARSDGQAGPNLRPSEMRCIGDPPLKEVDPMPVRKLTIDVCGVTPIWSSGGLSAMLGARVSMPQLARALSRHGRFDRRVVDQTGLSGEFDIMALAADDMPGATSDARFLVALREQLGLTLRSGQGTFDILRVRRIIAPTPN